MVILTIPIGLSFLKFCQKHVHMYVCTYVHVLFIRIVILTISTGFSFLKFCQKPVYVIYSAGGFCKISLKSKYN
jgi:hypothetical protein